jgi:competence protein ComEA
MKTRDQISGAAVIVMIAAALCFFRVAAPVLSVGGTEERPHYSERKNGDVVVALSGQVEHRGIYFIPGGSSLLDFMAMAGIDADRIPGIRVPNQRLKNASLVNVRTAGSPGAPSVTVNRMSGSMRFALGLPIELNSATEQDLEVVPGIGKTTALRIIDYRQENGEFKKVSDLMNIKGIKEKKYATFRRYFCVE